MQVEQHDPSFIANRHFKRDMFNVVVGIIGQTCLVALPIFIVIKDFGSAAFTATLFALSAGCLKKTWYDNLED